MIGVCYSYLFNMIKKQKNMVYTWRKKLKNKQMKNEDDYMRQYSYMYVRLLSYVYVHIHTCLFSSHLRTTHPIINIYFHAYIYFLISNYLLIYQQSHTYIYTYMHKYYTEIHISLYIHTSHLSLYIYIIYTCNPPLY